MKKPISKSTGTNYSEQILSALCENAFLGMWNYSNVYRRKNSKRTEEVCDSLVVFGNDIIVFQDKESEYKSDTFNKIKWKRWLKNTVFSGASQLYGAMNTIMREPKNLFVDKDCSQRIPIDIPSADQMVFHLVLTVGGVESAISKAMDGSSSLLVGNEDMRNGSLKIPFMVGDVAPNKYFVHIFNRASFWTLIRSRDTAVDFLNYLKKRELLFRRPGKLLATGEEELIAWYLKELNENNEHDFCFTSEEEARIDENTSIFIPEGEWDAFNKSVQRKLQLRRDSISYFWDGLIARFAHHAFTGTQEYSNIDFEQTEQVLRFMAQQPRYVRTALSEKFIEILEETDKNTRRARVLPPINENEPCWIFLLFPRGRGEKDENDYRSFRRNLLGAYCKVAKLKHRGCNDFVGIATEPGMKRDFRSEDLCYLNTKYWTKEQINEAESLREDLGILKDLEEHKWSFSEYPENY